jgi:hypothetical protein
MFQGNFPTCFFQEQVKLFGSYAPGPWLSNNLLKPQHQPGPWTGVRPAIRIGSKGGRPLIIQLLSKKGSWFFLVKFWVACKASGGTLQL